MHIFYQQARSDFAKKSGFHYAKSFHNLLFLACQHGEDRCLYTNQQAYWFKTK